MSQKVLARPLRIVVNDRSEPRETPREPAVTTTSPELPAFSSTNPQTNPKPCLVMKPIIPFALLGAFFAIGAAKAASTTPVGYVTIGDTTIGQPSIKAGTDVFASVALLRPSVFAGAISGVSGNVVSISGTPGFTASPAAGSFAPSPGVPYIVQISTGARAGLIALITANDASSLTLAVQAGDNLTGVVAGDLVTVREATTVSNFFESSPVPAGTQVLGFSGTTPGVNLASDLIFEFDGSDWVDTNSFESAANVVLFPGESFVIRNQSVSAITSIVVTGEVNATNVRTILPASGVSQDIPFSYFGAGGEPIGSSSLGAISSPGDQILLTDSTAAGLNKAASTIIEFDGSGWVDTNSFEDVSATFKFEPGVGYFLRAASSGDRTLSDVPAYVPGL